MKQLYLVLMMTLFAVCLASFVLSAGAPTLLSPAASSNHTTTLNVSCKANMNNATNVSILYNASGGAATVVLVTILNTTGNQSVFENAAVDISSLSDKALTYNFSCNMTNSTMTTIYGEKDNVTIDNTKPVVSVTIPVTRTTAGRTVQYSTSVTDAIALNNSNCSVTDPEGTNTTLSISASNVDMSFDRLIDTGNWIFTCSGIDTSGNFKSATQTVDVEMSGQSSGGAGSGGAGAGGFAINQPENTGINLKTLAIIAGIGVIVYLIFKKK